MGTEERVATLERKVAVIDNTLEFLRPDIESLRNSANDLATEISGYRAELVEVRDRAKSNTRRLEDIDDGTALVGERKFRIFTVFMGSLMGLAQVVIGGTLLYVITKGGNP